ncbi:MAG TPA: DNA replication/repair protein RecF [Phototrophicaceae bacterium]|jgi:DNA replication and repair protein RecF|nr:DNA replication/repair protein RecF [Phototrophicaceae bacterium]
MYLEYLSLVNFRNYARLDISLPDAPVVIYGANAQGKTSLLEAIYYLATSRSPYTTSDRQLIHWCTENDPLPFARLSAEINGKRSGMNRLDVTLMLERMPDGTQRFRKTVRINGVDKRVMDTMGLMNVVLFLPRDLTLVEGSPADRRHFMDVTLSQIENDYAVALEKYEKTLPQRNALLRRIADQQSSRKELPYWDDQLIESGSKLIAARQRFLREVEVQAQREHYDLTGKRETLTLRYQPGFNPTASGDGQMSFNLLGLDLHRELDADQIVPQFTDQLQSELEESIRRGITLSGPHRDELRILINERDAGLYGSRGQARTAVMSLKLAELAWMREKTSEPPILLLDEVAAELDSQRRAYLLNRIDGSTQTLLTTTELDIFNEDFLKRAAVWQVEDGQITKKTGLQS